MVLDVMGTTEQVRARPPVAGDADRGMSGPVKGRYHRNVARRKRAMALVAVMGLLAGIAVAYKLFEKTVPNNVVRDASTFNYALWVQDEQNGAFVRAGAAPDGRPIFPSLVQSGTSQGQEIVMFPGDSKTATVRINNEQIPASTRTVAGFQLHVEQPSIVVCRPKAVPTEGSSAACLAAVGPGAPVEVQAPNPDRAKFLGFWELEIQAQRKLLGTEPAPAEMGGARYATVCPKRALTGYTPGDPCNLGRISQKGAEAGPTGPKDQRLYRFTISELDQGDQTPYKGWAVAFGFVFNARVPPGPEVANS